MKFSTVAMMLTSAVLLGTAGFCLLRERRHEAAQFIQVTDHLGKAWLIKADEVKCIVPDVFTTNESQIFLDNGLVCRVDQEARKQIVFRMFGR